MIDRKKLLADLQSLLRKEIEPDLRKRSDLPEIAAALKAEFDKAKKAKRTAMNYTDWRADTITQIGVAWVLSCVFIRFLEDNRLVDPPRLSGPTDAGETHSALQRARDEYDLHIQSNPEHSFRQYILSVIDDLAKLPGGKEVFGKNNIIHQHRDWPSNDAAKSLYNFWQKIEPTTGELVHDFADDAEDGQPFDTRFLGDLYQDLSEAAREKYALLQTPDFVEAFILDRILEPALDEFGLEPKPPEGSGLTTNTFRMIDPACGSGHFLLGAFDRILDRWQRKEPGTKVDVLAERTLASIHGVDVNPFAVAIARFRLLLAAFRACHVTRLDQPIDLHINVACGDSLYHGKQKQGTLAGIETDESHYFRVETVDELRRILKEGIYHAVVANPPYIVPSDKAANAAYRSLYKHCHDKYALTVPFMERLFSLGLQSRESEPSGHVGQITANSFFKAEFGKKLVVNFFPGIDLTGVVDTSVADIPGHTTPTVILFGRCRKQTSKQVRVVEGIDGAKTNPDLKAGWNALLKQFDLPGTTTEYASAKDSPVERFYVHPWSLSGGNNGAVAAKLNAFAKKLKCLTKVVGRTTHTGEDGFFYLSCDTARRLRFQNASIPVVTGEDIRDYRVEAKQIAVFPYDRNTAKPVEQIPATLDHFQFPYRTVLRNRIDWDLTPEERGLRWFDHTMLFPSRYRHRKSIACAAITTHVHFLVDATSMLFDRTAPVIQLSPSSDWCEDELCSLLNSSCACYWGHHTLRQKAGSTDTTWDKRYVWNATNVKTFPLPESKPAVASQLMRQAASLRSINPRKCVEMYRAESSSSVIDSLALLHRQYTYTLSELALLQEELDWECYQLYGLFEDVLTYPTDKPLGIKLGQRAFEIVMARKMAAGELETTWFERHGSTPITELPEEWPDDYKALVNRRIEVIKSHPNIALIEQPEYKRRWNTEPWDSHVERTLREWMLLRLESYFDFDGRMNDEGQITAKFDIGVTTVAKLADVAFKDAQFKEVAEVYRGRADFDPVKLIEELVADEHVPALPILRYKPAGLDKRAEWENTWQLQRIEDQIHAEVELICREALTDESAAAAPPDQPLDPYKATLNVNKVDFNSLAEIVSKFEPTAQAAGVSARSEPAAGTVGSLKSGFAKSKLGTLVDLQRLVTHEILGDIPVPPKYTSGDFISTGGAKYWKLRGKLDVPKERWVSLPHCQGEDQTLPIAWAGYDHLQLLQAIAAYFAEVQQLGGSDDPRLVPLLAAMDQRIPWVKQWHNDTDNEYGYALGNFFEDFIATEARNLGLTLEDVRAWAPPATSGGRSKKTSKA